MRNGPAILLTGAAGFIGSHVAEALIAQRRRVVGIDNFDPFYDPAIKRRNIREIQSAPGGDLFELQECDIRDQDRVRAILAKEKFEGVIHLAAKAGVRPSIADPVGYASVNVTGTTVILEEARRAGVGRVVLASSSSVYGNNPKVPFSELDDVSQPISPYAATKRACELVAHTFHSLTKIPVSCLRFFTVYGPRQRPDLAIARFLDLIDRQIPEAMFGDGSARRDFTYVDDIVRGVLAAYKRTPDYGFRIWNLGGSRPITVREMVDTIARVVGKPSTITPGTPCPGDVERTYADLERSAAELGFSPSVGFEAGVRRQWDWLRTRGAETACNRLK